MKPRALLDSNVIVAAVSDAHDRHAASLSVIEDHADGSLAVAAHSYAECYNTLTRTGAKGVFRASPAQAWAALDSIRAAAVLVGLTPAQTLETVRDYAARGGIGPRLYDRLIGEAAVMNAIPVIITWNLGHMRGLFPDLAVLTPEQFRDPGQG